MGNNDFNLDMDNYIRKIRKKRSDPIDYSVGKAKQKVVPHEESLNYMTDEDIVIETKEEKGWKQIILSIFKRPTKLEDVDEIEEEIEVVPAQTKIDEVDAIENLEEDFEEFEEETESFFKKILRFLSIKKNPEDLAEDEMIELEQSLSKKDPEEILNDTKQIFKILNNWLNRLTLEERTKFKQSEDFKVYKNFLKKYDLIKN